jgi:hypothetical protein
MYHVMSLLALSCVPAWVSREGPRCIKAIKASFFSQLIGVYEVVLAVLPGLSLSGS